MNRVDFILITIVVILPCSIFAAHRPTSIADKIEPITTAQQLSIQQQKFQQQQQQLAMQESYNNRSPLLDSLFNIPIQTLRAVNDLVQGIASRRPSPIRNPQQ